MSGIVTFTTDFGLRDPFVAVMKARILSRCPQAALVDISHDMPRFQPEAAGFWLDRAAPYFPAGTLHVCVVDPGVGSPRGLVCVSGGRQFFLGPDNGLLARIAAWPDAVARRIDLQGPAGAGLAVASSTFHGRDILAPLAARLLAGDLRFDELGNEVQPFAGDELPAAIRIGSRIRGSVEITDSFGNIFSNIGCTLLSGYSSWKACLSGASFRWVTHYEQGQPGELVALVNAWGLVELAAVRGSAAARLSAERGMPLVLEAVGGA